jgi:hypothetical protein
MVFQIYWNSMIPGTSVNKYDLVCSRSECGSLVLKKGVAKWVERASVQASMRCTSSMLLSIVLTSVISLNPRVYTKI